MIIITKLVFYKEKPSKYFDTLYIELKVDGLTIGQLSNDGFSFTLFKDIRQNFEGHLYHIEKIEAYEVIFNEKYMKRLTAVIKQMEKEISKEENSIEVAVDNFFLRLNIKKLFLKELKKLLEGDDTLVSNN